MSSGYKRRLWPARAIVILLVVAAGLVVFWPRAHQEEKGKGQETAATAPSTSAVATTTTEQTTTTELPTTKPLTVPQLIVTSSRPVWLYMPHQDKSLEINNPILAMPTPCMPVIEPPLEGLAVGEVYSCKEFGQPGTNEQNFAVLAGHSSRLVNTVFNRLYKQGTALQGREVLVRTESSGGRWLVYRVTTVYSPSKNQLPQMKEVWGEGPGSGSTPGRLVLVTCIQPLVGKSTQNLVAVAQFEGVR